VHVADPNVRVDRPLGCERRIDRALRPAQRVTSNTTTVFHHPGRAAPVRPRSQSVPSGSPASSHSMQTQSAARPGCALSAPGTIVTPQVGQIGGVSSSGFI
jgi:hypothetical protein